MKHKYRMVIEFTTEGELENLHGFVNRVGDAIRAHHKDNKVIAVALQEKLDKWIEGRKN